MRDIKIEERSKVAGFIKELKFLKRKRYY